jgi:RimJ/RimL family protein N-acetyltransferase
MTQAFRRRGTVYRVSGAVIGDAVIELRPLSIEDVEAHLAGCDRAILDSLGGGESPTASQVLQWLTTNASAWARGEELIDLGIQDKATGSLCGSVGIQRGLDYLEPGQVNLTYSLYPNWRGRGYATRAVRLAMLSARHRGGVEQFVIRVAAWNGASIRVVQRLGFRFSHTSEDEHGRLQWFIGT